MFGGGRETTRRRSAGASAMKYFLRLESWALLLLCAVALSPACDDGSIGRYRRVIVNETALAVTVDFTGAEEASVRIGPLDSLVEEGTCYFEPDGRQRCDFPSNANNVIAFEGGLRLEQGFVSTRATNRWLGADIPVDVRPGDTRYGYTATERDGIRTYRYVIGAADLAAAVGE